MTIDEGVKKILQVEDETGLYVPVCWSKADVEERLDVSISDDDWAEATRMVDKFCSFSSEVVDAISTALDEIE